MEKKVGRERRRKNREPSTRSPPSLSLSFFDFEKRDRVFSYLFLALRGLLRAFVLESLAMARGMIRPPPQGYARAMATAGAKERSGGGGERRRSIEATIASSSSSSSSQPQPLLQPPPPSRRDLLSATTGLIAAAAAASTPLLAYPAAAAKAAETTTAATAVSTTTTATATAAATAANNSLPFPNSYSLPGPYAVARLPLLEHVCPRLSPACVGKQCAVTLEFLVPRLLPGENDDDGDGSDEEGEGKNKRKKTTHVAPPRRAPLAILSGGFLVGRSAYASTARHLCSWGFAVATYDKAETALDPLDDVVSSSVVLEIADFVSSSPGLNKLMDADRLYLVGHSRGGKLSVLAAARDGSGGESGGESPTSSSTSTTSTSTLPSPSPSLSSLPSSPPQRPSRVKALGLIDPVNNTVYAPQGPRYPSATAALRGVPALARTPLLAVGSGPLVSGRDCAPTDAAAPSFYDACRSAPAWLVTLRPSGHFQFLDEQTAVQRAVCAGGPVEDEAVRASARAALAAWGRVAVFGDGSSRSGEEEEEEERRRNGDKGVSSSSSSSSSLGPSDLLERTERDIEELLRDGMTSGGGGGEYTKKLRAPPFLSSQRKHISFS